MKRLLIGACLAAMAGTVGAAQSTPTGSPTQVPSSTATKPEDQKTVTYTGCLAEGTTPGTYVLNNVPMSGSAASRSTTGQTAGAATSPSASAMQSFKLSGTAKDFDMTKNMNHRVEIVGVVEDGAGSPTAGAGSMGSMPAGATATGRTGQTTGGQSAGSTTTGSTTTGAATGSTATGASTTRPGGQMASSMSSASQMPTQTIVIRSAKAVSGGC